MYASLTSSSTTVRSAWSGNSPLLKRKRENVINSRSQKLQAKDFEPGFVCLLRPNSCCTHTQTHRHFFLKWLSTLIKKRSNLIWMPLPKSPCYTTISRQLQTWTEEKNLWNGVSVLVCYCSKMLKWFHKGSTSDYLKCFAFTWDLQHLEAALRGEHIPETVFIKLSVCFCQKDTSFSSKTIL